MQEDPLGGSVKPPRGHGSLTETSTATWFQMSNWSWEHYYPRADPRQSKSWLGRRATDDKNLREEKEQKPITLSAKGR